MQILVLLSPTINLSDSRLIIIANNILMLKIKNDFICIHIINETLPEVVKDLLSCIYTGEREVTNFRIAVVHKTNKTAN